MSLCVIPARGGSRRIPRKNVRDFRGKPMIAWSIEAARESRCFNRIVVSTDDRMIADVALGLGVDVPFFRSSELADDYTPTLPVIADAITRLDVGEDVPVCCLYATAPFVTADDLRSGRKLLDGPGARFVMSVTTFDYPIQRALRRLEGGAVEMIDPRHTQTRSQDLEQAWHDAGQFYWGRAAAWLTSENIFGQGAYGLVLPRHRVQDIDSEEDWQKAEAMMIALTGERGEL